MNRINLEKPVSMIQQETNESCQTCGKTNQTDQLREKSVSDSPEYQKKINGLKSVIQIYLNKSEQLFQSNDFLKAIEYLNKLNEIKDYFVEADFLKAKCYEQLNMHDLALEFYHKSAENNHVEAINHKGLILNNDIESKKLFEKALELNKNPKSSKDFKNKGDSLLGLNKHNEALQCYDKAIQSNPNDAVLFNNKGASLSIMGKYQDAISCFNEAIESNPNYAEAFHNKGINLAKLGKFQEAIDCFNKAIQLKPNYAEAYSNKASSLANLGKYNDAIDYFSIALKLNPNAEDAKKNRQIAIDKLKNRF